MEFLSVVLIAVAVFGVCYLLDKCFAKLFRSKAQHMSGLAVRVNKRYGAFGVILVALGIGAILAGLSGEWILIAGGALILVGGICMIVYYLTFGVFYDDDSFLISRFGKKSLTYQYNQIKTQQLYVVSGNTLIELHMTDGQNISLQAGMPGVYNFMDKAFEGWCHQKGIDPETCEFHDPENSCWFPPMEE